MTTTATRPAIVQIVNIEPNQRFTFTAPCDGDGTTTTEYVKIGNKHYRKAHIEFAVSLPIIGLPAGIRTRVRPTS